jgi:glycosyltransferase involved in cell wall biosynthesis
VHDPLRVLYLGRLSEAKNVDVVIEALARFVKSGCRAECRIVGDGPQQRRLIELAGRLGIRDSVHFSGGLPHDEVLRHLEWADTLVLVSATEGWPKAIAEAMAFRVVCIGSTQGLVPEMLADGRGYVVPPRDPEALADVLNLIAGSEDLTPLRTKAAEWACRYSLEGLREAIRQLLETAWEVRLRPVSRLTNDAIPEAGS